jgi:hypothetical protein
LAFTTNLGRKLIVDGREATENIKVVELNLADEKKVLAGLKTKFQDKATEIYCYVTKLSRASIDDLITENQTTVHVQPKVTTKQVPKKPKRKIIKK